MDVLNQVFVLVVILFYYTYADPLVVETTYGKIRGSTIPSRLGKTIYSFRGVRFAKPPLGSLRFQPPQNIEKWNGVKDATEDGPACPQIGLSSPTDEDCLYLNVYSTDLNKSSKKPVLVFFHPGAWLFFSGRSDFFGPQYLLDRDVVLVTSNYRLGALGWLSSGDGVLLGNQGLKDQVAVLRWVKDNIASFGGDPDKVTIGGYSAGAHSVSLHLLSPMSKGLFKQAIIMSGSALTSVALKRNSKQSFQQQAEFLNCSANIPSQEVVDCLRTKSVEEIVNSSTRFYEWYSAPITWITPEVEKESKEGTERFLIEEPIQSVLSGRFAKDIPIMIGYNLKEFDYAGQDLVSSDVIMDDFNQNSSYILPILLMYKESPQKELITTRLKEFYLNNQPITKESEETLGHMFSDDTVNFHTYRAGSVLVEKSKAPVYFYHFSFQGRYSWRYQKDGTTPYGVVHHDDLMYIFYMSRFPFFKRNDPEIKMVEKYTNLFSNFLNYGNPNGDSSEKIWSPSTKENPQYLEIGNNSLEMHTGWPNYERMKFWDEIYPLPQTNKKHSKN